MNVTRTVTLVILIGVVMAALAWAFLGNQSENDGTTSGKQAPVAAEVIFTSDDGIAAEAVQTPTKVVIKPPSICPETDLLLIELRSEVRVIEQRHITPPKVGGC